MLRYSNYDILEFEYFDLPHVFFFSLDMISILLDIENMYNNKKSEALYVYAAMLTL